MAKYIYGQLVTTGNIININEVPDDRKLRGAHTCICPQCGTLLTARKGTKREPHFSHKPVTLGFGGVGNGCSAETANETALHKMAKSIIKKELQIALPAKEIPLNELGLNLPHHIASQLPQNYTVFPETILVCDEVLLEERIESFQPDAVVHAKDKTYFIEIKVAHKTTADKIKKVEAYGSSPMLEIDLSPFSKNSVTEKELTNLICTEPACRKWIFFPDEPILLEKARGFFETHHIVIEYQKTEQEKKRLEEENQRKQAELNTKRQAFFQPDTYSKTLQDFRSKTKKITNATLTNRRFYKEKKSIPFFVNIPITGEILFMCDRVAWQSYLFDRWVYNRKKDKASICIFDIFNELKKKFPTDDLFDYGTTSIPDLIDNEYLPYRLVRQYLDYLEALGFIKIESNEKWAHVQLRESVTPPNKAFAIELTAAIQSLSDKQDFPNVDNLISQTLQTSKIEAAKLEQEKKRLEEEQKQQKNQQKISEVRDTHLRGNRKNLLRIAIDFIIDKKHFSPKELQQHLQLSYSPTAQLIDCLEEMGIVGSFGLSRSVLISPEEWAQLKSIYFPV